MKNRILIMGFIIAVVIFAKVDLQAQEGKVHSVSDCIKIALKNNTNIVSAQSDYQMSRAGLKSAWGNFMPSISLSAQWRRRNEDLIMFRFKDFVQSKDSYYYGVEVSQPLFTGFGNYAELKQSRAEEKMAQNYLTGTQQQTVLEVKLRYYDVLKSIELLKVAEEALRASEQELRRIEAMEEIGSASRAEVYQQKVRVGEYKLSLIDAQNALSTAKAELNYTLGIDVNTDLNLEEDILEVTDVDVNFEALVNKALNNRVDYKAAQQNVNSAKAGVTIQRSEYYPSVSLQADYSWFDVEFPQSSRALKEFDNYSISLNMGMTLFQGFKTRARVHSAKASLIKAEAEMEQTKRQVMMDVKTAVLNLQKAAENVEVTQENLISAEEDYRLASERYRVGSGTLLEQMNAESSLSSAKANRIEALYDYQYYVAALELAVGNLKVVY
jgi:outer membrane protein